MTNEIKIGDTVKIKRGVCGEGYRFTVTSMAWDPFFKEYQVSGYNYGPRLASDVEKTK